MHKPQTTTISSKAASQWYLVLKLVCAFTAIFGVSMALAPGFTQALFGIIIFSNPAQFETFNPQATAYIALTHAVMGSVMVGWSVLMYMLVHQMQLNRGSATWGMLPASLACWYVPDTLFSLLSGFWQNALLNTSFAIAYAIPLFALRPRKHTQAQATL